MLFILLATIFANLEVYSFKHWGTISGGIYLAKLTFILSLEQMKKKKRLDKEYTVRGYQKKALKWIWTDTFLKKIPTATQKVSRIVE